MKARVLLKVRAGARATEFAGRFGDAWKLHVAAPPVDGKANEVIIRFFAKLAGVPASAVRIVTGQSSPGKLLEIEGLESADLERAILMRNGPSTNSGSPAPRKS